MARGAVAPKHPVGVLDSGLQALVLISWLNWIKPEMISLLGYRSFARILLLTLPIYWQKSKPLKLHKLLLLQIFWVRTLVVLPTTLLMLLLQLAQHGLHLLG